MPKILLVGQDVRLLGTRAAVLRKTRAQVNYCLGSQAVGRVKSERPDLVVLCHSLLEGEAESIADDIRKCCKTTKVLMVLSEAGTEFPLQDGKFDAICLSRPDRLIACAKGLLGGPLPHCVQGMKGNGEATLAP
ncbi:hypothetical protein [Tunturiibacter gelidoferens]|uniref:Response regulatory domain-containing protein n=1 Tax=Tunturiibacter lichenicola TaxID=2051959 RepID=A0A7Y9NPM0_9BACT|nr:hypothetical protein [Edaphobacter lichenicola]NYF52628.1 hypothetical protein [Edaphobacter lichenicola]